MSKVLIIEDDPHTRGMLNTLLQREGYETLVASDGAEGLKLFLDHSADVILLDIFMPEKDGLELILELRQNHRFDNIIAISGGGILASHSKDILKTAQTFGAKYAFPKPFNRHALLKAIGSLCQARQR
ncbi:MAG: response regulator [candidate division KSB1 bacterium]|nr:response regulator [candidate division KSB1 bacterium]MDQ7063602.1 response regulator [candidate division KSB1 bacterium]